MDIVSTMIRGNADRGYGEHLRSWVILSRKERVNPESRNSPSVQPQAGQFPAFSDVQNTEEILMEIDCTNSDQDRQVLTSEPSVVLLNLANVTRKIFGYLPLDSLRSCLSVCEAFRHVAQEEMETRSRPFILARKMSNIHEAQDLLGQMILGQYDHFLCDPEILFIFKNGALHPRDYRGDALNRVANVIYSHTDLGQPLVMPKNLIRCDVVLGENIFHAYPGGAQIGCSFSVMQVPSVPGLIIRRLEQGNWDHALRIGHFRFMQHAFDDISPVDLPLLGQPGFLLLTHASTLGVPDIQYFDQPFCGVKKTVKENADICYVWCGLKTRIASLYLDDKSHRGNLDLLSGEFEKIHPNLLQANASAVFGFYFTTAPSMLSHSREELLVFRKYFPTGQLMGCSLRDSLFGNTASTVCETSLADRTVKVSHATGGSSASAFFLVVLVK